MAKESVLNQADFNQGGRDVDSGFTDERLISYLGTWDRKDDVVTCPKLQTIFFDMKKQAENRVTHY
jgi:hypothetical protein